MSTRLPLPLELTQPVELAGDLTAQFGAYDAKTQLCSNTSSHQQSRTVNLLGIVQVDAADVQVDDVIA